MPVKFELRISNTPVRTVGGAKFGRNCKTAVLFITNTENGDGGEWKGNTVGNIGEMEGSEGWKRIPYFCATAGDIQTKHTRVSGGFDFLVGL